MMSKCQRKFLASKERKLFYLALHFMQVYAYNIRDIMPLISDNLIFKLDDHNGLIPLYYNCGLPCRTWVCVTCKQIFNDD